MTQLDLDELQKLADEATTGPWRGKEDQVESDRAWICDAASGLRPLARETANAAFIAAAREAVPDLIREVRQLRANLAKIAEIHFRFGDAPQRCMPGDEDFCAACGFSWPCATYLVAVPAAGDGS